MMSPEGADTYLTVTGNQEDVLICHNNMMDITDGVRMFYAMNNRYPDRLAELEVVDPGLCTLTCPSCGLQYLYDLSDNGEVYTITCPLPLDPNHGCVVHGHSSWPPDPPAWPGICHGNMRSLASAMAMFYGIYNCYPDELSELGTSGIYSFWDEPCPACGYTYIYETNSTRDSYSIYCPLPIDPNHGYVIDGMCYWPPDTSSGSQVVCRSNMRSLASAMAMFYGYENRYPDELSELGTSGVMGNWDVPCPACGEIYSYINTSDSTGASYLIQCPLPWDPGHGSIEDGIVSWE